MPKNFDWVRARAGCSLPVVFKELHDGIQNDVESANAVASHNGQAKYSVTTLQQRRFSVVRVDGQFSESVEFLLDRGSILVRSQGNETPLKAGITLNPDGGCKLVIYGKELEQWQFRRMALEQLFFTPPA